MTKRTAAKYKIDRRMGENIWGRPKSPVNRRDMVQGNTVREEKLSCLTLDCSCAQSKSLKDTTAI